MNNRRGYPYREKKKKPAKVKAVETYVSPPADEFDKPKLGESPPATWSRQDAQVIIDSYADLAWPGHLELRRNMLKLTGYFIRLWEKQCGRCALTGLSLYGAVGLGYYGIGIDLLRKGVGVTKGNIRLVSCPLAYSRYYNALDQKIFLPDQTISDDFGSVDVAHALARSLYRKITDEMTFKHMPITVTMPQDLKRAFERGTFVEFAWNLQLPQDSWNKIKFDNTKFLDAYVHNDVIHIGEKPNSDPFGPMNVGKIQMPISDPTIDYESVICDEAKKAFKDYYRRMVRGGYYHRWGR